MPRFTSIALTALALVACDDESPAGTTTDTGDIDTGDIDTGDICAPDGCAPGSDAGPTSRSCADGCYLSEICEDEVCVPGPLEDMLPAPPEPIDGAALAFARVAAASDLLEGRNATGQAGDFIIGNDRVRYIIERAGRRGAGLTPFGGNVIDAQSLDRPNVEELMKVIPLLNLGLTVHFDEVRILNDGSDGKAALILAVGSDTVWDAIDLNGLVGRFNLLGYDVNADLDVMVGAVYALAPGDHSLRATFTVWNQGVETLNTPVGIIVDPRGPVRAFTPTRGYGDNSFVEVFGGADGVPYFGYHGDDIVYGFVPLHPGDGAELSVPDSSALLAVAGVGAALFDSPNTLTAVAQSTFDIPAGEARSFGFYAYVGAGAPSGLHAAYLAMRAETPATITGTLNGAVEGARVAVLDDRGRSVTVADAGSGAFEVQVVPGTYSLLAGAAGHPLSEVVEVEVGGGGAAATLALPETALLEFDIEAVPLTGPAMSTACRIDLIGPADSTFDVDAWRPLADLRGDSPPAGYAAVRYARHCDSARDGPIKAPAGRYLAVVSHGPTHSILREVVDLAVGTPATVTGGLHEVIDTSGYVGMDCHVHSVESPDSKVTIEDRVLAYLAEDIGLIIATDHDRLTDFEPAIEAMGLSDRMGSVIGVETTPFVYGHFIAFPQVIDPTVAARGAPDHSGGHGPSLAPPQIWAAQRANGARVVQLAHPSSYFSNGAALTFDPMDGLGVDLAIRTPNEEIRIAAGEPMFGTDFDTLEIATGASSAGIGGGFGPPGAGESDEPRMNSILRHWFNFLSVGMPTQGVGCSDTHRQLRYPPGYSRTYVPAVSQRPYGDIAALEMAGTSDRHGDTLVTNGPWMSVRVGDAAPGRLVESEGGGVDLDVTVEVPVWMQPPPETLEVFVNNMYAQPGDTPALREMAPVQTGLLSYETVELPNGGQVQRATTTFPLQVGGDAWVVARLVGGGTMFPLLPADLTLDAAGDTPGTFVTDAVDGAPPFAVSNPIFVDGDADGVWTAPFAAGAFAGE